MKVGKGKEKNSSILFGYLLEHIIKIWWFGIFFLQNWANLGYFLSQENSFV
jgi:hypothetical protein